MTGAERAGHVSRAGHAGHALEGGRAGGTADLTRADLVAWGAALGRDLAAPAVIALSGDLGAGKTTLVQAICSGYGVLDPVTSPTFALVHQYRGGPAMVFHLDLYRINSPAELANLGWDELLDANAVVLIEWPERAAGALPRDAMRLSLAHVPGAPDVRRLAW
ncbi:MAG: tRNA (adenosine(37)-N6)-threonylcarbamoyltransferase complex ATPase subunit type 1 TsaE [Gemmatimonadota bacterium]|nr:tRNA (adenosine(37)-N6)-threonylcarbamoyltransferase complex ATPase subunit type 1 TsaE [Gemmatimonadota bacterium]